MLASCVPRRLISRRGLSRHQREISGETVTECLRPYLGALFPKRALLRRQPRKASVGLKVADQGISALQSDPANGLNIIGHDGDRPTGAPVTAARDSGAVRRRLDTPSAHLPAWLGWVLSERLGQWSRSFRLGQADLTFPDHTIQPVKLAPDPVLRFPVSQG
jgi:hypothetical protein